MDAGLEALDTAMGAGFEQFAKIRSDPNLETLRKSPKFKQVIDKYDEPVFNDNALKCALPRSSIMSSTTLYVACGECISLDVTLLTKTQLHDSLAAASRGVRLLLILPHTTPI